MVQFKNDEKLFRAVRPKKINRLFWNKDGTRITSLAFKNRPGESYVSVDRQENRPEKDCIESMKIKLEGSIVSITYEQCLENEIDVIPKPTNKNKYHTGLINATNAAPDTVLTDIQCQNLADNAVFEYKDF